MHIRRGKGHRDRFVPLPALTHRALRALSVRHRHPLWLFPCPGRSAEATRQATALYTRLTDVTDGEAIVTVNQLLDSLHVDLRRV